MFSEVLDAQDFRILLCVLGSYWFCIHFLGILCLEKRKKKYFPLTLFNSFIVIIINIPSFYLEGMEEMHKHWFWMTRHFGGELCPINLNSVAVACIIAWANLFCWLICLVLLCCMISSRYAHLLNIC